ncbi:serine/threonine-protein kinase [Nocardiopsis oceani]
MNPAPPVPPASGSPPSGPEAPTGFDPLTQDDPRYLGPFRLVGRLGVGGMGVVYAGLDDRDRRVAVKSVHRVLASDTDFVARFAREVALVRRVRAACVPAFVGADTKTAVPWLATEYVPGPTLGAHVRANGPLHGEALTAFALGVAEALASIHAQGVVHRDLKPGNVILAPDGPKVLDFGIARATDGTALTKTGGMLGTPGWVAPEQYRGQDATELSDVFSWAGLAVYAATGEGPFGTGRPDVLATRIISEPPSLDGVPDPLRARLERALAKAPEDRPRAAELRDAMAGILGAGAQEDVTLVMDRAWSAAAVPAARLSPASQLSSAALADEWSRHAPPRRGWLRRRRAPLVVGAAVLAVALTAGLGARALLGGDPLAAGDQADGTSAEAQNDSGGETATAAAGVPDDAPAEYQEHYERGEVVVETDSDTEPALLRSLQPASDGGEALAQLRLTFAGLNVQELGRSTVTITAEYLPDHGSLQVHNSEFATVTSIGPGDEHLRSVTAEGSGVLAELSPEEPTAEFTVAFVFTLGDGPLVYYVPDALRDQDWNTFDYPGGFCVLEEEGPTFPESAHFGPHDTTLTDGVPTDSCAYDSQPAEF